MKTTIEMPDALFRRMKVAASTNGQTLKEFLTDAVERKLRAHRVRGTPAWKKLHGALAELRRETRALDRRIEQEFERVDAEDAV